MRKFDYHGRTLLDVWDIWSTPDLYAGAKSYLEVPSVGAFSIGLQEGGRSSEGRIDLESIKITRLDPGDIPPTQTLGEGEAATTRGGQEALRRREGKTAAPSEEGETVSPTGKDEATPAKSDISIGKTCLVRAGLESGGEQMAL